MVKSIAVTDRGGCVDRFIQLPPNLCVKLKSNKSPCSHDGVIASVSAGISGSTMSLAVGQLTISYATLILPSGLESPV